MKISLRELRTMIREAVSRKLKEQAASIPVRRSTGQLPDVGNLPPRRTAPVPPRSMAGAESSPGAVQTDRTSGRVVPRSTTVQEMIRKMVKEALSEQSAEPAGGDDTPEEKNTSAGSSGQQGTGDNRGSSQRVQVSEMRAMIRKEVRRLMEQDSLDTLGDAEGEDPMAGVEDGGTVQEARRRAKAKARARAKK
jgi:hypothetical protein